MKVDFVIPAYNEEGILERNIELLLTYLRGKSLPFSFLVTIAVNGSTDRSAEIAQKLEKENPGEVKAFIIERGGKGNAVKEATLASSADAILYMDVDLAVSLEDIEPLLAPIISGKSDLVIASRLLSKSQTKRSIFRTFISLSYNFVSRIILEHTLSDLQCGFKAGSRGLFQKIFPKVKDERWFFDTELVALSARECMRISEIPVSWEESRYAERQSKVKVVRDSLRFLRSLALLRWRFLREDVSRISVKNLLKKHFAAILLAIAIGAVYAAPHIYFANDPAYRGIYMAESPDEVFYMTGINKAYKGSLPGNPYLYEYQDTKNPFQFHWMESMWGWIGHVSGLSVSGLALLMKALLPALLTLVGYALALLLSGNRAAALLASAALLLGNELARPSVSTALATLSLSGPFQEFLLYSRPINPSMSGLFLWGAFIASCVLVRNPRSLFATGSLGVLIGILAYTYFYFWVFVVAFAGVLFLYALLTQRYVLLRSLMLAGASGLLLSLPFIFALSATLLGGEGGTLAQAVPTHRVILEKMILLPLILYGSIFIALWWLKRQGRPSEWLSTFFERYQFVFLLLITGMVVSNQQVITGKEVQQHHFHFFTNIPLFVFSMSLLAYEAVARFGPRFRHIFVLLSVSIIFWHAVGVQASSYAAHYASYIRYQALAPIFRAIEKDSPEERVVLGNDFVSTRLTVYTQAFAYNTVYDSTYAGVPRSRVEHNYFVLLALRGVTAEQVRDYIYEKKNRDDVGVLLFAGQYYRDLCGSYGCFSDSVLEDLIVKYQAFLARPLADRLREYKIDYLIMDSVKDAGWQISSLPIRPLSTEGDFTLYEFR